MTVLSSTSKATHEAVDPGGGRVRRDVVVDTITESGKKELLPAKAAFPASFAYLGDRRS